ncbi:hypothetical protein [Streptomyces sp. TP-A0874]|uniref:hypothetical protein n=1 Tax=Streptomyces sp. TP-A0874 TaxID=549819 RepID=UPI000852E51D|nr:hypothetical protein [Streptomyces sp. TP-A0874]
MSAKSSPMPPVRLLSEAELAGAALSGPRLARAVRLARWAAPGVRVDAGGALLKEELDEATAHLGLAEGDEGRAETDEAWLLAVDTGLVEVEEDGTGDPSATEDGGGTATTGETAARITAGSPREVLDIWLTGLEAALSDAAAPDISELVASAADGGEVDLGSLEALDRDRDQEGAFLESVLRQLYRITAHEGGFPEKPVPLPALVASVIAPQDMAEPTDEVLEEVSAAVMRLDERFRLLEPIGLLEYRPVDLEFLQEFDEPETEEPGTDGRADGRPVGAQGAPDQEDLTRYGLVRLTPLGVYGIRAGLLEAGEAAPLVGELAEEGATTLLDRLPEFPDAAARAEIEGWLGRREVVAAAGELLAAGRGDDERAPLRRLGCQQALSLLPAAAEPALREVLDDPQLGGLARVWLVEHGARDVPEPSPELVFWLTVDTIAAQLAAGEDAAELEELVRGLADQHSGFFEAAWRVEHPATAEVLAAMGRLHPDPRQAKEARTAAFKARSRRRG